MKKIYYFLFLLIGTLSLTSCLSDDSVYDYSDWQAANDDFFQRMKDTIDPKTGTPYYKEITAESYPAYKVLYHVINEGQVDGRKPYYTSTVEVKYKGHLYNTTVAFDSTANNATAKFKVNEVIAGWTWALQNMTVGSKWEIVIPWELAYGMNGSGSIPPYSALVFDVELVSIPKWQTGTNPDESDSSGL